MNGIWNRNTYLEILDNGYGNWGFMTNEVDHSTDKTISAISIDQIMKDYDIEQIDICKINIEGSEKDLFEKNYEQWVPKTKAIIIELHDRMKEGCSKSFFKAMVNYDFDLSQKGSYLVSVLK
jgi:FkbM family methyltransferase